MSETRTPQHNRLVAALPSEVQSRLMPHLEPVFLPLGTVLYESGDAMDDVYFPTDSIVSLVYVMENGLSTEVSMVGNDGIVGISLFMGGESTPSRAIVQSAGHAYTLSAQRLKNEFNRHGDLMLLVLRYTQSLITQTAQTAVCARHHSIEQRLCRRLLLSLDLQAGDGLVMTQRLIAEILGVRREGVTDAAGKLQKLGAISYRRGQITVLDRTHLERLSCECYAVFKKETDRLLPYAITRARPIGTRGVASPFVTMQRFGRVRDLREGLSICERTTAGYFVARRITRCTVLPADRSLEQSCAASALRYRVRDPRAGSRRVRRAVQPVATGARRYRRHFVA